MYATSSSKFPKPFMCYKNNAIWQHASFPPVATLSTAAENPIGLKSVFPLDHNAKIKSFKTPDWTTVTLNEIYS